LRITIISPFSFGYIDTLVSKLEEYPDVSLIYLNTTNFKYQYNSFFDRLKNFWLKSFSSRNLKSEYIADKIKNSLEKHPIQDIILVIRPDKLNVSLLHWLQSQTKSLRTFYFDGTQAIPEKIELIPLFDKVYSYDKKDVEKYDLEFLPNFIPYDVELEEPGEGVFNISSHDNRFETLEKIALQLKEINYPYNIIVRKEKNFLSETIKIVQEYMSLKDVIDMMKSASILLDIQKENQQGLSFRVFEALGYNKKLITTNKDIANYDFYRPENILIIESKDPLISKDFLEGPYVPVAENIKVKYRRQYWIEKVFGVSKSNQDQRDL